MDLYEKRARILELAALEKEREVRRHQRWLANWAQHSHRERVAARIKLIQQLEKRAKRNREEAYVEWHRHQALTV